MYQRYYKQRKFGRIFSFCMVIGSGLSYYIKSSIKSVRNLFKLENLEKHSEYLPENMKSAIHNLREIEKGDLFTYANVKSKYDGLNREYIYEKFQDQDKFSLKSRYWIYKNNLDRSINFKDFKKNSNNFNKFSDVHSKYCDEKEDLQKNKSDSFPTKEEVKYKETYRLYRKIIKI